MPESVQSIPHAVVLGASHHTSDVALRDALMLRDEAAGALLDELRAHPAIREAVLLCTCNRCDLTLAADPPDAAVEHARACWAQHCGLAREQLAEALYVQEDDEALRHLLRVSCSLDSLVVGESQVFGQVKDAFFAARDHGAVGFFLDHIYRETIRVGKRVRSQTAINEGAVSISYAAVELARKVLGRLEDKHVGIIGSGEMGELAARHLYKEGARTFTLFNRSRGSAEELAARFNADVCLLPDIDQRLHLCDVVIAATDAPGTILSREQVQRALGRRNDRRVFLIDIAAPRDIDPAVGGLLNTYLFTIDDLKQVVRDNAERRSEAAAQAEAIIDEELETITAWTRGLSVRPVIRQLRAQYEAMAMAEIESVARRATPEERERLEFLGRSLLNKFLHQPLTRLREIGEQGDGPSAGAYAAELFGLETDTPEAEDRPKSGGSSG